MWRSVLVSVVLFLLPALVVHAEATTSPEVLNHYHLVPEHSTLHITGGFAGVDQTYSVQGEYDLRRFFRSGDRHAMFSEVDVVSPILEGFPAYIDVTELLGLEGLTGEPIPLGGAPFEIYRYEGETFDHMRFELYTAIVGPWMYLQGSSYVPRDSADLYEYEFQGLARTRRPSADMNGDGLVDAADYTALRDANAGAERLSDWREQFGERTPSMGDMQSIFAAAFTTAAATATAVPEPSTGGLLLLSLLAIVRRRR